MPAFIPFIDRIRLDANGCWNWRGAVFPNGYGRMRLRGRRLMPHRVAAELWLGLPKDSPSLVLHRCDNHACFNPKHLFIGTQRDNLVDCVVKKRHWNSRKTHCKRGHEFTSCNTRQYIHPRSGRPARGCKLCAKLVKERG